MFASDFRLEQTSVGRVSRVISSRLLDAKLFTRQRISASQYCTGFIIVSFQWKKPIFRSQPTKNPMTGQKQISQN
jgi:hypothetical protein